MARPIPDALKRRHWIEQDLDPARAARVAAAYLAEGRRFEALAFLAKAGDTDGIRRVRDAAVAEGDVFLLRESSGLLEEEPDLATWRALAENAASAGKDSYAREAARQIAAKEGA